MPEVLIKYKNERALKALQDLAKVFDMSIGVPTKNTEPQHEKQSAHLPISYAKNPDVTALAGIWEGRDIDLEELREKAWGDRI